MYRIIISNTARVKTVSPMGDGHRCMSFFNDSVFTVCKMYYKTYKTTEPYRQLNSINYYVADHFNLIVSKSNPDLSIHATLHPMRQEIAV